MTTSVDKELKGAQNVTQTLDWAKFELFIRFPSAVKKKAAPRGKEVKPTCYFSIDVKGSKCVVEKVGHNERLAEALIQSYDMINEVRTLLSMVFGKLVIRTNQMEQKEKIKPAKNKK